MFEKLERFINGIICCNFTDEGQTPLEEALSFFLYDTIKITILLFVISIFMGALNAWMPVHRLKEFFERRKFFGLEYFAASIFGAITPFCSCSSIPLFIGFLRGGLPLGVCFSFLITSPLINEIAVAAFLGVFGLKATLIYVFGGLLMGTLGGFVMGKMRLEKYLSPWLAEEIETSEKQCGCPSKRNFKAILKDAFSITKSVLPYIIIGIGIGALMHGFVPEGFFAKYLSKDNLLAVPLAVFAAIPLYANAAGVVPIVQVLVEKGVPLGTAIAFMMAVVGLSLPEAMLLKKAMSWRLIGIFFGFIGAFIVLLGYLFNLLI